MPVRDEIMARPTDIQALQRENRPIQALVDALFVNFTYYARQQWQYIASASAGGEQLLAGTAVQVPCGGLANAFRILVEQELGVAVADREYVTLTGYVWTSPKYSCFDPRVKGNVRLAGPGRQYDQGCLFNEHYFLRVHQRFYDPCLNTTYDTPNAAVRKQYVTGQILERGLVMEGDTPDCVIVFNQSETVTGWQKGAWMIVRPEHIASLPRELGDADARFALRAIAAKATGRLKQEAVRVGKPLWQARGRLQDWQTVVGMA